jgi:hypothetical protein
MYFPLSLYFICLTAQDLLYVRWRSVGFGYVDVAVVSDKWVALVWYLAFKTSWYVTTRDSGYASIIRDPFDLSPQVTVLGCPSEGEL